MITYFVELKRTMLGWTWVIIKSPQEIILDNIAYVKTVLSMYKFDPDDIMFGWGTDVYSAVIDFNTRTNLNYMKSVSFWENDPRVKIIDLRINDIAMPNTTAPTIPAAPPEEPAQKPKTMCGLCGKDSDSYTCKDCQFKYYGLRV